MTTLRYFALTFFIGLVLSACGSDNNSTAPVAQPDPGDQSYYISDNTCYRSSDNQRASDSRCSGLAYAIVGGVCYQGSQSRDLDYCTDNTYYMSKNGCYDRSGRIADEVRCGDYDDDYDDYLDDDYEDEYGNGHTCEGEHLYDNGNIYFVNCDGRTRTGNCSGYILYDVDDKKYVRCD